MKTRSVTLESGLAVQNLSSSLQHILLHFVKPLSDALPCYKNFLYLAQSRHHQAKKKVLYLMKS